MYATIRNEPSLQETAYRLQDITTDVCGHYCVAYCLAASRDVSHEDFLDYWRRRDDGEVKELVEEELSAIQEGGTMSWSPLHNYTY